MKIITKNKLKNGKHLFSLIKKGAIIYHPAFMGVVVKKTKSHVVIYINKDLRPYRYSNYLEWNYLKHFEGLKRGNIKTEKIITF